MRYRPFFSALAGILILGGLSPDSVACSTFCLRHDGHAYFGKNYDWHLGQGMLIVNPAGLERSASVPEGELPTRWVARHGSVTFNQYGRDFPNGGVNQGGLVVELMWLDGTGYPERDRRTALSNLQWIQYQLDTANTVEDVLASDDRVRILGSSPLHYLVADRSGRVATVEFLDGELRAHSGNALQAPVLTNNSYADSVRYLQSLDRRERPIPADTASLNRFARAARQLRQYDGGEDPVAFAFATLGRVAQGSATRWSIVYDLTGSRVHYRTSKRRAVKYLDLDDLDFSCRSVVKVLDLDHPARGDVRDALVPYTRDANLELIRSSFAGTDFLAGVADERLRLRASVPERAVCRH